MMKKKTVWWVNRSLALPLVIVALSCVGPILGGLLFFEYSDFFQKGAFSAAVFALAGGLSIGLAILPSFVMAAGAGWLFDGAVGLSTTVVALAWGALLGLWIGRLLRVNRSSLPPKLRALAVKMDLEVASKPDWSVGLSILFLRLAPHAPFALTNFVAAQIPVSFGKILFWSILGLLPRTLTAFFVGQSLAQLSDAADRASGSWVQSIFFLGLIVLLTVFLKKWFKRTKSTQGDSS